MVRQGWCSLLFVPADDAVRREKAARAGADAVILDLEDGVGSANKADARAAVAPAAAAVVAAGPDCVVRINGNWQTAMDDLRAAVSAPVRAIMVPKAESASRLIVLAEMLAELEAERGLPVGHTSLIALIESPAGLMALPEIAACPRVIGLALGPEDLAVSLGVAPSPILLDLPARQLALAAASRGQMALAVPLSIAAFRDVEGYEAAARQAAAFGVTGALCIHPNQVRVANAVFRPSDAEQVQAARIVAAWETAQAEGRAVTTLDGVMIDRPVVLRAHAVLARAQP